MKLRVDVYVHYPDGHADHRLDLALNLLQNLLARQEKMMANLDEVLALVTAESTALDSVIALIDGLQAQLNEILAGNLPAPIQAKVDAVFAAATTNAAKIVDALDTNVPPPTP